MKTEKELSLNIDGLLHKISNDNLRHEIKVAFHEYRDEMYKRLLNCNQNLAHPAYGHSSSTSIGIDNLRNETFDFLEIPEK
jgi:hypothetical protein